MPFVETSSMYEIAEADLGRSRSSPGADPEIKDDPGEIKEGQYRIEGDLLRVEDKEGRPLGRARLRPGDDAEAAARKILRESHGRHGSFYDPIHSQNLGIV
jgi:hypothetical protein